MKELQNIFEKINPRAYNGKIFIQVRTNDVINNHFAIAYMESSSTSFSNRITFPHMRWELFNHKAAFMAITLFKRSGYPFKVIGEGEKILHEVKY